MTATRSVWLTGRTPVRSLIMMAWFVWGLGVVLGFTIGVTASGAINEPVLLIIEGGIFALLIAALVVSVRRWPERRLALLALTTGVVLWAVGSMLVNSPDSQSQASFPAPGEWLFLLSYVAMAAFIVLDAGNRRGNPVTAWLDAAIVCSAAAALCGVVLLTPFTKYFPDGGLPLLVALIYPVIDLALALLVVGQLALGSRTWSAGTLRLVAGFAVFAVADSSFVLKLATGPYAFTIASILAWGLALILIVSAACSPRPPLTTKSRRLPNGFLVASFVLAVALLVLRRDGTVGLAVALAAVCTLVATAGRLVIALRDSQAATDAIHLARTDDLTGLPNRRALVREVSRSIDSGEPFALMMLGLDGFKEVNDTLGHGAGDTLLELVATRLRGTVPPQMMLARVGGDEFAILVNHVSEIELLERAQAIRRTLLSPMRIEGLDLAMRSSVGIAAGLTQDTPVEVLRRADVAMYEAKSNRTGAELYRPDHDEFSRIRLQMGEDLRRAMRKGDVTVWFQPKVDTTGLPIGFEALVRWERSDGVVLSPAEFLPVARRAGLMRELSEIVARDSIAMAAHWHRMGLDLHVAINMAPEELLGGQVLPVIYRMIREAKVPAHVVTLEVIEDSFLADPERAWEILQDVSAHGLRVSIDDYGTGFSSLSYLKDLPADELKLDKSFVSHVCIDDKSRLIVASTVDMAHALGLLVVAEGVEDQQVTDEVVRLGVDRLQGYFFAKPMRSSQVDAWLRGDGPEKEPLQSAPPEASEGS